MELHERRMLTEPNQGERNALQQNGSQMDVRELHQYILQLREYIATLERRIASLEKKVNPPHTRDLGNGRRGLTWHGANALMDDLVGVHQKNPQTGEWEKIR